MSTGGRVAAAVAAGYLLGRTKKLKLAIAVGSMMAGKRIATNPRGLARQANELIESNDQLSQLSDEVRDKLVTAARTAAISVASNRLESFSDSLHERSEQWRLGPGREQAEEEEEEPEEEEPEPKKAPAKRSSAKKAPAKKASTKASTERSSTKKASTKKAPAKKTSTKKSSGRRATSGTRS